MSMGVYEGLHVWGTHVHAGECTLLQNEQRLESKKELN